MLHVISFLYISVYFVFVNLVIKVHTSSTDNFNRNSALAESIFSKMLHLPKSFHREKYSFSGCIRDRKGCNKFHVLKKAGGNWCWRFWNIVCTHCTEPGGTMYSWKKTNQVQIQPCVKVWSLSVQDLKSQIFLLHRKKRLIQGNLVLFAMKLGIQEPPHERKIK